MEMGMEMQSLRWVATREIAVHRQTNCDLSTMYRTTEQLTSTHVMY